MALLLLHGQIDGKDPAGNIVQDCGRYDGDDMLT